MVVPGHGGGSPGLIDEHQPSGIKVALALEPGLAPLADVGPVLLGGMRGLFLRVIWCRRQKRQSAIWCRRQKRQSVIWCRRQKRQSALTLTCAAFSAKRAFNSGRVMSGT